MSSWRQTPRVAHRSSSPKQRRLDSHGAESFIKSTAAIWLQCGGPQARRFESSRGRERLLTPALSSTEEEREKFFGSFPNTEARSRNDSLAKGSTRAHACCGRRPHRPHSCTRIRHHLLTRRWDRIQFAKSRFGLRRGASEGVYPQRSSTERTTKPQGKPAFARRVAALLACGFVARRVTERCAYAPLLASRHKPKSLQQTVFYPTVWSVVTEFARWFRPAGRRSGHAGARVLPIPHCKGSGEIHWPSRS